MLSSGWQGLGCPPCCNLPTIFCLLLPGPLLLLLLLAGRPSGAGFLLQLGLGDQPTALLRICLRLPLRVHALLGSFRFHCTILLLLPLWLLPLLTRLLLLTSLVLWRLL